MNESLAKSGLYNNVMKQKIATVTAIRNHAAHGQWNEFDSKDVEQMISWVRLFLENSFGTTRLPIKRDYGGQLNSASSFDPTNRCATNSRHVSITSSFAPSDFKASLT